MDACELIAKVADWSQRDRRIIAAGVCGSCAGGEGKPDSALEFCILPRDLRSLLDERSWIDGLGADAVIQGCTEIGMLVQDESTDVRLFDTTRIPAEQAVADALA